MLIRTFCTGDCGRSGSGEDDGEVLERVAFVSLSEREWDERVGETSLGGVDDVDGTIVALQSFCACFGVWDRLAFSTSCCPCRFQPCGRVPNTESFIHQKKRIRCRRLAHCQPANFALDKEQNGVKF